jgi:hypothetical protein
VGTWGTIGEDSGWIQFEFRWTPVSPHPNSKQHLRKVPWVTQNTTCPHGYLRRGIIGPNDIGENLGNIRGGFNSSRGMPVYPNPYCKKHLKKLSRRQHSGNI